MNTKGQNALEGMIAFSILIILFIGTYIIYDLQRREVSLQERDVRERADCFKLANLITTVFTLGEGTETTTTITHPLTIYPLQQRIETDHSFCTFPTASVTGENLSINLPLELAPGKVHLQHQLGGIIINNE